MRIKSVVAEPISGTIRPEIAIRSSLGSHTVGQYVLVRITDEDGRSGIGEATVTAVWSGETQQGTIAMIDQVIAPLLQDADPFDTAWIRRKITKAAFANSFAHSAIEMALLDLQARILDVPVYQLLGGRNPGKDDVRLKFVVGAEKPEIAAERAAAMAAKGWTAIKVKVGKTQNPQDDVDRLAAVRDAVGPDTWLSVDANGAFPVMDAVWLSQRLVALDVKLFEQPTPRGRHDLMAQVRQRSDIPIMADESIFTYHDALDALNAGAADVLSLYPGKHQGVQQTQEIARLAEAFGVPCTIGSNLEREVATAAMAHLVAATPNLWCERFPGDLIGPLYFTEPLTSSPLVYRTDRLCVPQGPGWGVDVQD